MRKQRSCTTAKEMLRKIDTFLVKASRTEREKLWNVMTALRGPDDRSIDMGRSVQDLKTRTTCQIRRAAFPKTAKLRCLVGIASFKKVPYVAPSHSIGHFEDHILRAASALRLKT